MLWPLSCCCARCQPLGGQGGARPNGIRPMTMQMLQPCCFRAVGSRWGLGRSMLKDVLSALCFEVESSGWHGLAWLQRVPW